MAKQKREMFNWSTALKELNDAMEAHYFRVWVDTNNYKRSEKPIDSLGFSNVVLKIYSDIFELANCLAIGNLNVVMKSDDKLYLFLNQCRVDDVTLINIWDTFNEPVNEALNLYDMPWYYASIYENESIIRERICWFFVKMRNHLSKLGSYVKINDISYYKFFQAFGNLSAHGRDKNVDKSHKQNCKNSEFIKNIYKQSKIDFYTPFVQMIDDTLFTCYQLMIIKIFVFFKRFEKKLIEILKKNGFEIKWIEDL
jgi:hypothetical protein